MNASGGLGPWFIGLFFNLNSQASSKKQTELRIHGSIHLFAELQNSINLEDCWTPVMIVGPFDKWSNAVGFYHLWSRQTRGKYRRLKRGVSLLHIYHRRYRLCMWVQAVSMEMIQQLVSDMRARLPKSGRLLNRRQRIDQMLCPPLAPEAEPSTSIRGIRALKKDCLL